MVDGGNGKEHRERTLSCLLFVLVFYFIFCFIKHGGALFIFWYFFFFFFNIVLTWKFVEASKASVLYIYIDYPC